LVSTLYAAIGLGIASYVNRKGVASAIFIGGVILFTIIMHFLYESISSSFRHYLVLFTPQDLARAISVWLFQVQRPENDLIRGSNVPGPVYALAVITIAAISAVI